MATGLVRHRHSGHVERLHHHQQPGITAYADGQRFSFRADRNNTGAATLNVDARGAKGLRKVTGGALAALAADEIVDGAVYDVVFVSSDDVFVIVGFVVPDVSTIQSDITALQTGKQDADDDLAAIAALAGTGIAVRTAADTWAQRQIVSADGSVTITNPAGVAGTSTLRQLHASHGYRRFRPRAEAPQRTLPSRPPPRKSACCSRGRTGARQGMTFSCALAPPRPLKARVTRISAASRHRRGQPSPPPSRCRSGRRARLGAR